jgi:hypothetical protein
VREFLKLAMRFRSTAIVDDDFPRLRDRFDGALSNLLEKMPPTVCLCGSTRFYDEFQRANFRETMAGKIVLSVGFYPHAEFSKKAHGEDVGITPDQKVALDELHKRKIDLADEILVLNVGGYIGDSTRSEIAYAKETGKTVRWLEPVCSRCSSPINQTELSTRAYAGTEQLCTGCFGREEKRQCDLEEQSRI